MTRNRNSDAASETMMDIHQVMKHLPHRYPFLLIDRVIDYKPGESLTALKNVSYNEPYFTGHFPIRPVMPGVLILEYWPSRARLRNRRKIPCIILSVSITGDSSSRSSPGTS